MNRAKNADANFQRTFTMRQNFNKSRFKILSDQGCLGCEQYNRTLMDTCSPQYHFGIYSIFTSKSMIPFERGADLVTLKGDENDFLRGARINFVLFTKKGPFFNCNPFDTCFQNSATFVIIIQYYFITQQTFYFESNSELGHESMKYCRQSWTQK